MRSIPPLRWTVASLLLCSGAWEAQSAPADANEGGPSITPPEAIQTEEVRFHNGETTLAGAVLLPSSEAPVPGVVVIHGSGTSDRSQPWASAFARGLAERGIAVLLPDKRGSGASGGDWKTASFEVLADDAVASAEVLALVEGVDGRRVGILGLSQGGHVAPLAATRSPRIAFVVDVAGSAVPITEQVIDEVEKLAERQGFSRWQIDRVNALHRAAIHYGLTGEDWEEYESALAAALESDLAGHGVIEPFPRTPDHWVWSWARAVGEYDPLPYWKALAVPGLVVYGGRDTQIHVRESVDRVLGMVSDRPGELTVIVFGRAGHGLGYQRDHAYGIRPDVLRIIASWILGTGPGPSGGEDDEPSLEAAPGRGQGGD